MTSCNGLKKPGNFNFREITRKFDDQLWITNDPITFSEEGKRFAVFSSALLKIIIDSITQFLSDDQKEAIFKNILVNYLGHDISSMSLCYYEIQIVSNALKDNIVHIISEITSTGQLLLKNPPVLNYQSLFKSDSRYRTDFHVIEKLGRGGFGNVYKVFNKLDSQYYAIKRIPEYKSSKQGITSNQVIREVETLAKLSHVNIVRYFAAWAEYEMVVSNNALKSFVIGTDVYSKTRSVSGPNMNSLMRPAAVRQESTDDIVFEYSHPSDAKSQHNTQSNLSNSNSMQIVPKSSVLPVIPRRLMISIQMELCDETLESWLAKRNRNIKHSLSKINMSTVIDMFRQILQGVAYMHSESVIHRDLKPPNIFLVKSNTGNFIVKIGDFGLSRFTPVTTCPINSMSDEDGKMTTNLGTHLYAAPEVHLPDGNYDSKSDMYSLGVVLLELLYPFATVHEKLKTIKSIRDEHTVPIDIVNIIPSECKDLLTKLLNKNPLNRPSAQEVIDNYAILSQDISVSNLMSQIRSKDEKIHELEEKVKQLQLELSILKGHSSTTPT